MLFRSRILFLKIQVIVTTCIYYFMLFYSVFLSPLSSLFFLSFSLILPRRSLSLLCSPKFLTQSFLDSFSHSHRLRLKLKLSLALALSLGLSQRLSLRLGCWAMGFGGHDGLSLDLWFWYEICGFGLSSVVVGHWLKLWR